MKCEPASRTGLLFTAAVVAVMTLFPKPAGSETLEICIATNPCIDFGALIADSGTISYAGGSSPLVGSEIPILRIDGFGTPENPTPPGGNALDVLNGVLSFETGPLSSFSPVFGYLFEGGGFFTITGGIPELDIPEGTVLLNGTFTEARYLLGPLGFHLTPIGTDTKDSRVVEYFGLDPLSAFSFQGFIVTEPLLDLQLGGPFSVDVLSVDIPNVPGGGAVIPEPGTLLLVGVGGLVARRFAVRDRRKISRKG